MERPASPADAHRAIDRLAALRRAMTAMAVEEEALARRVFALPDGRHEGIACAVDIATGRDGTRRIAVTGDILAAGMPTDPRSEAALAPAQME